MARFPARESEILALAHQMAAGFTNHSDVFPNPPIPSDQFQQFIADFQARSAESNTLDAQAAEAHAHKDEAQASLVDSMKTLLRYAENTTDTDAQLGYIGWSGRSAPASQQVPGPCRALEAVRRGQGWVFLDWKEPIEGGKPAAYHIQRRELPGGDWTTAGIAVISEATITDPSKGKTVEFRVFAVNKAGDGAVSNGVEVIF